MDKDKTGANFHDGVHRFYTMRKEKNNFIRVRNLVIKSAVEGKFCGTLNDRAPLVSRFFLDIDVNKHEDGVVITDEDLLSFVVKFNVVLSTAVRSKKGFFDCPDPTPQIYIEGNNDFQWYTHPRAEKELEELRIRNGRDNTISERLEVIKKWIDPATIIILRSRLTGRKDGREDLATYHLIFPFIIGQRKLYSNIVKKLKDKNEGLYK